MRKFAFLLIVLTLVATQAPAAVIFYSSRAAFEADAGALSLESFEAVMGDLPKPLIDFGAFYIEETNGINALTNANVNSFFTASVTDGTGSVWYDDNGVSISIFQFASPITAFGLDIASDGSGILTIGGDVSSSISLLVNTPQFWGVIMTGGTFSKVTFDMAGGPEVGFDRAAWGTGGGVIPEPSTFVLAACGAALLGLTRKLRR